jgi:formylglycine-generating enzyme required for sulfatase activity
MYKRIDSDMFDKEARRAGRGGSWYDSARYASTACRDTRNGRLGSTMLGFRLCRDLFCEPAESTPTPTPGNEDAQES